jgi:ribulose bisphosphate carboxylase small subunit
VTQQLYKIEEMSTMGWTLIETHQVKLTKEQCKEQLELYLQNGYNPNTLRAVPDHD